MPLSRTKSTQIDSSYEGFGLIAMAIIIILCGMVVSRWLAPSEAERAASIVKSDAAIKARATELFREYRIACGATPYPSSACPAWTYGEGGAEGPTDIIGVVEDWKPQHPCFKGQIKARQTMGMYFRPEDELYDSAVKNIVCFNTATEAEAQGYHLFTD